MADYAVLVNGLPGSGRSALAARLASLLAVPLIAGDAIEEALADAAPGLPPHAFAAVAGRAVWDLAAAVPDGVVLDSSWYRDRAAAEAGLARCGATASVEIWCEVPADLALTRHLHHPNSRFGRATRWAEEQAHPLGITDVIAVRTDHEPDLPALAARIGEAFRRQRGTPPERMAGAAPRPPSPLPNSAATTENDKTGR